MLLQTIIGGVLISTSTSLYLYMNGLIAGFSGIIWSVVSQGSNKKNKTLFLLTLLMTNSFVYLFNKMF